MFGIIIDKWSRGCVIQLEYSQARAVYVIIAGPAIWGK